MQMNDIKNLGKKLSVIEMENRERHFQSMTKKIERNEWLT
jgi:hypothetical protein